MQGPEDPPFLQIWRYEHTRTDSPFPSSRCWTRIWLLLLVCEFLWKGTLDIIKQVTLLPTPIGVRCVSGQGKGTSGWRRAHLYSASSQLAQGPLQYPVFINQSRESWHERIQPIITDFNATAPIFALLWLLSKFLDIEVGKILSVVPACITLGTAECGHFQGKQMLLLMDAVRTQIFCCFSLTFHVSSEENKQDWEFKCYCFTC